MPGKTPDLIIAFDTAGETIALAIGRRTDNGSITPLASDDHPATRQANVRLMPALDALFAANNLAKHDVSCVVCGLGPGSFTGVRIGVATAKGIARGLGVPLFGVSTLDAVAWGAWLAGIRGNLGVVADAMRGEVYPARFKLDDLGTTRLDPHTVTKAEAIAARWNEPDTSMLLVGDGLKKYAGVFAEQGEACSPFALGDAALWTPTGAGLLRAFEDMCTKGCAGSGEAGTLLPIYTRLSDAEENERKRLANGGQIAQGALTEVPLSGVADPARAGTVAYRPMAAGDLDQVCALEQQAFPAGTSTSGECWTRTLFADELTRGDRAWWVACMDDQVIGFAGAWVVDGTLQILDLAVARECRRKGIARRLLDRLMTDGRALGAVTATLEVRESNEEARALYASLGFEHAGVRPQYYAPLAPLAPLTDGTGGIGSIGATGSTRESAVIMTRALKEGEVASACISDCKASASLADAVSALASAPTPLSAPTPSPAPTPASASAPSPAPTAPPVILAIETSCDETAAAVIDGGAHLLSNVIASQVDFHARFGGVVPEIASRKHTESIVGVVDTAMEQAGFTDWQALDALAVTYAPGLIGALVVGVAFAKGLAWATGLPLIRVNHLEGHIYANRFASGDADRAAAAALVAPLAPPFIISLLSGGHTMLVHVRDWGAYRVLGQTLDDAVGEAFDKVAKALGLGYPGGPVISRLAEQGDPRAIDFPRALLHSHDYRFSLSGLKTAVITFIKAEQEAKRPLDIPAIAASFQQAVIDVQVAKALEALEETGCTTFCIGGGVAANHALREACRAAMEARGIRVIVPPSAACTDNAAMIAYVALDRFHKARFMNLDDDACAQIDLESQY
jgi:N6-L-threonylcarbamoyladenine synthase